MALTFMGYEQYDIFLLLSGVGQAVQFPFSALWLIRRGSIHRALFDSSQLTASVNDSRQILPSLPLVRIMYIMLN